MSTPVAPRARRTPISRVRSLTAIQEIPRIPNPETMSALAPIHSRKNRSRLLATQLSASNRLAGPWMVALVKKRMNLLRRIVHVAERVYFNRDGGIVVHIH